VQLSALEGGKRDQIDSKRTKSSGVKVVGTIGMNSKDVDTLRELLLAGMTVRCPAYIVLYISSP
jgi:hypothetical protein